MLVDQELVNQQVWGTLQELAQTISSKPTWNANGKSISKGSKAATISNAQHAYCRTGSAQLFISHALVAKVQALVAKVQALVALLKKVQALVAKVQAKVALPKKVAGPSTIGSELIQWY
eukprot:Em0025g90a